MTTTWQLDPSWTQQIGGCIGIPRGAPAQLINGNHLMEQELPWRQLLLHPVMWWDSRRNKKRDWTPGFRRKGSSEVFWLNRMSKRARVDEQFVSLDLKRCNSPPSKVRSSVKHESSRGGRLEIGVATAGRVGTLCQQGRLTEAVEALESLAQMDCRISEAILYDVLKLCRAKKDLVVGRRVHDICVKLGYESNTYLGNHILRMYACAGRLQAAMDVFTRVSKPDTFMWFSIISAHAKHGKPHEAVQLYNKMRSSGVKANAHVFVAALQACAFSADLDAGRKVHFDVLHCGLPANLFVENSLVDMYAKCGDLEGACKVFGSLASKDVVSWNALIAGYANHGLGHEAFVLYGQMEKEGRVVGNQVTLSCLLKVCASTGALEMGRQLQSQIVERGLLDNVLLGTRLVDMYVKCGELEDAQRVFDSLSTKDVQTWTALIAGYANQGFGHEALVVYSQMEQEGLTVDDHVTFARLLKACSSGGAVQLGRQLHSQILERGQLDSLLVGNSLVDMYARCGQLEDARMVFECLVTKDVVTWTALIAGYANYGLSQEALVLYGLMEQEGLLLANHGTFSCLLKACASAGAFQQGRQLHSQIVESGQLDNMLVANGLVDMYAKCGELETARELFETLATKDVVTWNSLIAGYANHGLGHEALVLYERMEQEGLIVADHVTFACLLKACASAGAVQNGRKLHSQIVERGQLSNIVVGNSLVDMYTKCGDLEAAQGVFDSLVSKDVVTWNALLAGLVSHGLGEEALSLYGRMEQEELIVENEVTFACLLKACATAGALQTGRQLHSRIVDTGQLDSILVGTSLVDMYAKCGELEAARRVFDNLAIKNVVTWNALIAGCGSCDEAYQALACFEEMLVAGIQPDDTTFICLLGACSHQGLVTEGRKHFDSMLEQHGVKPDVEHYNCMIDLLGRAGQLDEAENMLLSSESQGNVVALTSLLNACKIHRDIEKARRCFESLVRLEPQNASAYVLMAKAYANACRWTDVDKIELQRKAAKAYKKPAVAGIEVNKQVHRFVVGDSRDDIALKVENLNARLTREGGHVPHTKVVLKPLSERGKENILCGHAEKLALAFGLLNTQSGTPLVVTKNLRMCSDCHSSSEIMSRIEERYIVVRDGYRVHRFAAGCCSCKGRP